MSTVRAFFALLYWVSASAFSADTAPVSAAAPAPALQESIAGPSIRFISITNGGAIQVQVVGLSERVLRSLNQTNRTIDQWQTILTLHAEQETLAAEIGLPPMAGEYRVEQTKLIFTPRFSLVPGLRYRATFHPVQAGLPTSSAVVTATFQAPRAAAQPATVVSHIYPSATTLPENLLKFYLHFSAPMSRGHIYDHIHLRDDSGHAIELPFLEIDEELWDPEMKRLTLFIDPGRIKRGVQPLEEVGPALQQGRRYTLVIDRDWHDATGNPLREPYQKQFLVGVPDRDPPDPSRWRLQAPAAGSRDPLKVTFTDPMDHALALRMLRVMQGGKSFIEGSPSLEREESVWSFVPDQAWRAGSYQLQVTVTIEDLAGNNVGKPFEVDLFEGIQRRLTNSTVKIPFRIQ